MAILRLTFLGTLGVWGDMSQVSLIVLLKEFISDFLEHLLSGKRTVCLGIASSLKSFLVVCKVMFLSLELIWLKFSCGINSRVFPVYS